MPRGRCEECELHDLVELLLETVPSAAFVTTAGGEVVFANGDATRMLKRDRARTIARLKQAVDQDGGEKTFEATRVARGEYFLVRRRESTGAATSYRLHEAVRKWGVTPRQADVLALLVDGYPNASIAQILGIAVRTVEVHVTSLLERAQVESRTALVARALRA